MKKTLFLILSGCIVIFSIICICSGPIITLTHLTSMNWKTLNCQELEDKYKEAKKGNDEDEIKDAKKAKNKCNRSKAMYGLEYSSLIVDVICGFVCTILGLLHYFDVAKPFEKVTGIIGLATGIIGFVLTFVYLVYSAYIFTNDPYENERGSKTIYKRDGDWAYSKLENGKFKCLFYKEKDENSIYAKYSDLGKKQYNYNEKQSQEYSKVEVFMCTYQYIHSLIENQGVAFPSNNKTSKCGQSETLQPDSLLSSCKMLYIKLDDEIFNKYLFDKWVTTIIFSCFIIVCDIGLAIFGYLLFKSDGSFRNINLIY